MTDSRKDQLPEELAEVVERLRSERPEASALELDQLKVRAMEQARHGQGGRPMARTKIITALAVIGLAVGGSSAVVAHHKPKHQAPAKVQYKSGKGCGDKNHVHEREAECKKPAK